MAQDQRDYRAELSEDELASRRAAAQEVMQRVGYAKAERPGGPVRTDVTPDEVEAMKAHLQARGMA